MGGHDGTPEQCLPNQLVNFVDNIRAVQSRSALWYLISRFAGFLGLNVRPLGSRVTRSCSGSTDTVTNTESPSGRYFNAYWRILRESVLR